ncbi:glycosyltransferase family 22 protein [Gigaspora margarita]|uniref:Mannosyltransferase n=1 Tax=Gigaspora margarita TaxID=4874 RepID=A0A8H4A742_GIGMA|nr:glycosyltransferase family 22 protein [Gigaspora margarita]
MDKYDFLLGCLITLHLLLCPFTKVEESFNLQASHDIMEFGISLEALKKYDHFEFPGVVPRTFVGPLFLSLVSWPTSKTLELLIPHLSKFTRQYIVRFFLGISTSFALSYFRSSIAKNFGYRVSIAFGILSACQFHTIFWASRTLPNMFAFPLVIFSYSYWISVINSSESNPKLLSMICYMTFTAVIFRFEVGVLLAIIVLFELWIGTLKFFDTLRVGIISGVISLGVSCFIDTYFWQTRLMWPEGYVFYFNAILGKSVEWGVLPFNAYFTTFLPRLLLMSLPLCIFSVFTDRTRRFLTPILAFIGGFSFLGHKEWRFIIYVVPIFNLCAAIGWITIKQKYSRYNYPGGVALQKIHIIQRDNTQARIHLDVYTAMTGASRFGQLRNDWMYYKNESHSLPIDYTGYTHLLTSTPHFHGAYFEIIDTVYGYEKILLKNPSIIIQNWLNSFQKFDLNHMKEFLESLLPVKIIIEPKVWIMKRYNVSDFTEGEHLF